MKSHICSYIVVAHDLDANLAPSFPKSHLTFFQFPTDVVIEEEARKMHWWQRRDYPLNVVSVSFWRRGFIHGFYGHSTDPKNGWKKSKQTKRLRFQDICRLWWLWLGYKKMWLYSNTRPQIYG